jgi:hypothetical protein
MTLFIKLENGQPSGNPITELTFRRLFTNTSFPKYFTANVVEPFGHGLYDFSSQPKLGRYEKAVEIAPVRSSAGIWRQTWQVVDMDDNEKAEVNAQQETLVRNQRNHLLSASDWTQIADAPVDATLWATYRQALRDITNHVNFPHLQEADWPTKP